MVETVGLVDLDDGMNTENPAFDDSRQRRSNHDTRQNRLVERADNLFNGEGNGGNRCVECGSDSSRDGDRCQAASAFRWKGREAGEHAGSSRTNLHSGPLAAERSTGTNVEDGDEEFSKGVAEANPPTLNCK